MSGELRVGQEVTYRRQKLKENQKELASENHQEIHGTAADNVTKERWYTSSIHKTPFSSRKHDNGESRAVFDEGGWPMQRER